MNKIHIILILFVFILSTLSCSKEVNSYLENDSSVTDSDTPSYIIEQNKWTYSMMHYHYYWTSELKDSLAYDYETSSTSFFDSLLSENDRFSWITKNSSYNGGSASLYDQYGLHLQSYTTPLGVEVHRILHAIPDYPAYKQGFRRGDWIRINESYASPNTQHAISIEKGCINDNEYSPIETSQIMSYFGYDSTKCYSVSVDSIYLINNKKIGYFVYDKFMDNTSNQTWSVYRSELKYLFDGFKSANIDDLIIDLRYNSGGYVSICQFLCSLVLADELLGQISGYQEYNEYITQTIYDSTGNTEDFVYFSSKDDVANSNIGMRKVYVILTKDSYSASESLVNTLSAFIDVIVVGNNSGGKGVGSYTLANNNYMYQLQPITFRYYNKDHQTVPDEGITPDIFADESLEETIYQLGDTRELLLSKAIEDICGEQTRSVGNITNGTLKLNPINNNQINNKANSGYIKY